MKDAQMDKCMNTQINRGIFLGGVERVRSKGLDKAELKFFNFYPWSPEVKPWVFRWTFSPPSPPPSPPPPPPSSHFQLLDAKITFVDSVGWWVVWGGWVGLVEGYSTVDHRSCAEYALLFINTSLIII